jgi:hypothetical protein
MTDQELESTLNYICAGGRFARVKNGSGQTVYVLIKEPTLHDRLWIDFIHQQALDDGKEKNLLPATELLSFYKESGTWSDQMEAELKGLQTVLDELEKSRKSPETSRADALKIQKVARVTKERLDDLSRRKAELLTASLERSAEHERVRALVYCCAHTIDGDKYWPTWNDFENEYDGELIDSIISSLSNCLIPVETKAVRKIARSGLWRVKWNAAKANCDNLFGKPLVYLSRSQESLVYWSQVYDSAYEAYERPSQETIDDDEALDKWFEEQALKRKQDDIVKGKESGKFGISQSISKHGEIGIVTNPAINHVPEWVRGKKHHNAPETHEVYDLNDPLAKKFLNVQNKRIKNAGVINEQELRSDKDSRRVIGAKDAITHRAKGKDGFTRRVVDKTLPGGTLSGKKDHDSGKAHREEN